MIVNFIIEMDNVKKNFFKVILIVVVLIGGIYILGLVVIIMIFFLDKIVVFIGILDVLVKVV